MKFFHKITALALSLTASLIMVGCGGESTSSTTATSTPTTTSSTSDTTSSSTTIGQGTLSIHLTDAPANYEAVYVTIAEVHVHLAGTEEENTENTGNTDEGNENDSDDGEWIVINMDDTTYELLELQGGVLEHMGNANIPSGKYTQLRLVLGAAHDGKNNILGVEHPEAHYIILDDDNAYALKVPSNTVKSNHNFTLPDSGEVKMIIDFDANKSIHPAGDQWILQPKLSITTELQ